VRAQGGGPDSAVAEVARAGGADTAAHRAGGDAGSSIEARLEELDQKIRVLQRLRELEREAAATRAREAPTFTAGAQGFALRSADGAFQLRFRGYTQSDGRFFRRDDTHAATSTFLTRRVRPIVEGTLYRNIDFRVMPDFGGGAAALFDAHVDVRVGAGLALRAGKQKPPVGLERLQSATDLLFVERGLPTNLVPSRDVGVQLHGDLRGGALQYQLGVFNGAPDLANGEGDSGNDKDVAARVLVQPFASRGPAALRGLGVGVAGTRGAHRGLATAPALAAYRSPAQQAVFGYRANGQAAGTTIADGEHARLAPQGYLHVGRLGLLGEYVLSRQEVRRDSSVRALTHAAWQLAASWVLTGEKPSPRGVAPRKPFDPATGQWGALEAGARIGRLTMDGDAFPRFADPDRAVREADSWGIALNWYLARGIRVQANYERTAFAGGAPNGGDRRPERAILTRFQVAF
jgi:phosphate-selective porin OprO/OprP